MVMLVAEEKPARDWKLFYQRIICWGNRQPWLTIRRIIWVVTVGWLLASAYAVAALSLALTIVFIPFVPNALKIAWFALDPVTKEAVVDPERFKKPFVVAANAIWAILFGWAIFCGFLAAALVQVVTIIGIPTALTFWDLGRFALLPFGATVRTKFLPTTVMEYRAGPLTADSAGSSRARGGDGNLGPLSSKGAPMGEDAV